MDSLKQIQDDSKEDISFICMHRDIEGHSTLVADSDTRMLKCTICGELIKTLDQEEIQSRIKSIQNYLNRIETGEELLPPGILRPLPKILKNVVLPELMEKIK